MQNVRHYQAGNSRLRKIISTLGLSCVGNDIGFSLGIRFAILLAAPPKRQSPGRYPEKVPEKRSYSGLRETTELDGFMSKETPRRG